MSEPAADENSRRATTVSFNFLDHAPTGEVDSINNPNIGTIVHISLEALEAVPQALLSTMSNARWAGTAGTGSSSLEPLVVKIF
jgi:hypothetical protein